MKRTKVIVTLGPSTDDPKIMKRLIEAGANVFRLNFSHGSHEEHLKRIIALREIEKEIGKPIPILQDLQGPKVRVGDIPEEKMNLVPGREVTLTISKPEKGEIPVQYDGIVNDVSRDDKILLDDGLLELKVLSKGKTKVTCKVVTGGILSSKKGINLPSASVALPALTTKDKDDLCFGLENDVDYIALSFVKSAQDIINLKKIIKQRGKNTKVIAKIERHEAVRNIDEIIDASDAIMVARGDLGIEVSLASVPLTQKEITRKCLSLGKPVVVATQMLDSMIRNPSSTRAETSDIANAILDGADAVMLSGETSVGKYPLNAVKAMKGISLAAEKWSRGREAFIGDRVKKKIENVSEAIGKSTCALVKNVNAKLIVNATASGQTTRSVSRFRPDAPIISVTHTLKTARELQLVWGVFPYAVKYGSINDLESKVMNIAKDLKLIKKGDKIVLIAGQKVGIVGGTNMIKVIEV